MEKQISIIIPTYNMERYIGKCLDSLLIPELDAVEVLVVNDGSKDRSSEIAHLYAKRYPDSIRVIDKENGNYGTCINAALPLATGRYVKVLDADDTFDTYAFSEFVRSLPECDEDVICTGFYFVTESGDVPKIVKALKHGVQANISYKFNELTESYFSGYTAMHQLCYRKSFILDIEYHQTEGVSYTDTQWSIIPLSNCITVRFVDLMLYRYLIGREGQTMDRSVYARTIKNMFPVLNGLTEYYNNQYDQVANRKFLHDRIVELHKNFYNSVLKNPAIDNHILKEYDESLKISSAVIYDAIGQLAYDVLVDYRPYAEFRRTGYKTAFKIPFRIRLLLSIKSRSLQISKRLRAITNHA